MRIVRGVAFVLAVLTASAALAQEKLVVAGPEPATLRLGDVARAEIRITDPKGTPRAFELPQVDGLLLRLVGPSQQSEQTWNGRNLTQRMTLTWQVEMQPTREGTFVVPSFAIWTGSKEQPTRELRLDVKKDLRGEELGYLDIAVLPLRVYVHEPIRVHVDAGVQQGLRLVQGRANNGQIYYDVEVQAGWLDEFPGGERIETGPVQGNQALMVRGGNTLIPVLHNADHQRGGERWLQFSFDCAFLPTRIGKIELPAPTLRYHVIRREGRQDVFGLSRGGLSEQYYVYGKPVTIEVLPIPEVGRPTPFYGAVGRFSIEAALDRESVRVGSSVKLTLTVRGRGNLEFLRVPALDALPLFHKLGQAEAKRDADKVIVTYDLAPLSTDVREVPAIDWNYFDTTPGVEQFVQVSTAALPLQVQALVNGETLMPLPESVVKAVTPGVDDIFDLPTLDGAAVLVVVPAGWLVWLVLVAPWLLVVVAMYAVRWRRRLAADVIGQRARRAARVCAEALQRDGDALAALAAYLGDRLGVPAAATIAPDLRERLLAARLDEELVAAVLRVIEHGTSARYGGGATLAADAVKDLVTRLEGRRFGVNAFWFVCLSAGLALGGPSASATAQAVTSSTDPVALYRTADYRAAEAGFAKAFAATGDRRLWRARGNCFVRLDDLPRALWAFECARLALPRDEDLLANLQLVRQRLSLEPEDSGLMAQLRRVSARFSASEQIVLGGVCMTIAALCLLLGWRRVGWRWVGVLALLPGGWVAVERLALAEWRQVAAIAVQKLAIVSEPRVGLEPVATVRPGVTVTVLGGSDGGFVRVQAGDRVGYVAREQLAVIE